MTINVKICGLSTPAAVRAAVQGGASHVGFVFFAASPRAVTPDVMAALSMPVPAAITRVGLFVDASFDEIAAAVATGSLDMLQLHGAETPGMVAQIKERFKLPVMKAVAIASDEDIATARLYEITADRLLFDAKPPPGADRPGGNALSFDWRLIADQEWLLPWMLAGGLEASNLAEAITTSGATAVDVSSGVEDEPGVKNPEKIKELLALAGTL
ncbi:MAG: phosphoribosylanthranilate isomerase [Rhodospirillaceae bacterium]|nr:phosphoribosylanthranilate isomerase [Rhodospirillaceae bacterium]MBT5244974.1 phosphoribosylanthranilate isomerase [Rhodospirillaceae bacterium]MBT5562637.1 phosphoribosylanthranilate isomerase [Rhodospirillaceae bacterium]MBT6243055.1 phosphoribosylanthranilate isomerase [Rhodospirillaceae bacterium]MBT7136958.1 phosphoribosylanthranilate isomerase [Rhodospirillaceae bacterium]